MDLIQRLAPKSRKRSPGSAGTDICSEGHLRLHARLGVDALVRLSQQDFAERGIGISQNFGEIKSDESVSALIRN